MVSKGVSPCAAIGVGGWDGYGKGATAFGISHPSVPWSDSSVLPLSYLR